MLSYYSSVLPHPAIPPYYFKTQHCVEPGRPMILNMLRAWFYHGACEWNRLLRTEPLVNRTGEPLKAKTNRTNRNRPNRNRPEPEPARTEPNRPKG